MSTKSIKNGQLCASRNRLCGVIRSAPLGLEAGGSRRKGNRLCQLRRSPDEVPHRGFQMMYKFERSRTCTMMCFDTCRQYIVSTGLDTQFKVGEVVRYRIGRDDLDGVSARQQVQSKLSRALL